MNGDNETDIYISKSLSLSFYDRNEGTKLQVKDQQDLPIEFWIPKHGLDKQSSFSLVNVSNVSNQSMIVHRFGLDGKNVSLHVEIKTNSSEAGFVTFLKFGQTLSFNESDSRLYCPAERAPRSLKQFMNMSFVNGFKGVVKLGVKQLNRSELAKYCNYSRNSSTSSYALRVYTSGCYFYDQSRSAWSSRGVEILSDSNETHTHCQSTHLTEFAGGLSFLPTVIDFDYVFAHASFRANKLIYSTVIVVSALYILAALWCWHVDKLDCRKMGFYLLGDNSPGDSYFYEVLVHTGTHRESETSSKVQVIVYGECGETSVRTLNDKRAAQKHALKRGCIDSFLLAVEKPLGALRHLKVWHDNSGRGDLSSWYLKEMTVHDLQTRDQFHFT